MYAEQSNLLKKKSFFPLQRSTAFGMVILERIKQICGPECFTAIWDFSSLDIDVIISKGQQLFMFVSHMCIQNEISLFNRELLVCVCVRVCVHPLAF